MRDISQFNVATFLVALLSLSSLHSQQGEAKPAPGGAGDAGGPTDPVLRKDYKTLVDEIAALGRAEDSRIRDVDTRVTGLVARLDAAEGLWAFELSRTWAEQLRSRDPAAALRHLKTALDWARRVGEERRGAQVLISMGNALADKSLYREALVAYDEAAYFYAKVGDERDLARIAMGRGSVFNYLGRNQEALVAYDEAAKFYAKVGDEGNLAGISMNRGNVFSSLGRHQDALVAYDGAARFFATHNDEVKLAKIAMNRGMALDSLTRYGDALIAYDEAAKLFAKLGDEKSFASTAVNRSIVFKALGRYQDSLVACDEGAELFAKLDDQAGLAFAAMNRGSVLRSLSRYDEALVAYDEAARSYAKVGHERGLAMVAANRGNVFSCQNRYQEALVANEEAARFFAKVEDEGRLAQIALNRGNVLSSLGRNQEALRTYDEAATFYAKVGDNEHLSMIATNRGHVLSSLNRYDDALVAYDQVAQLAAGTGADGLQATIAISCGNALSSLGRHREALVKYDQAARFYEEVGNEGRQAMISMNRGSALLSLGRHQEALAVFDQAAAFYGSVGDEGRQAMISMGRGKVFRSLSRYQEALQQYSESASGIGVLLHRQVQSLGQESSESFRLIFQALVPAALRCCHEMLVLQRDSLHQAYQVLQTFHGLGTAELLAERRTMDKTTIPQELREEIAKAQAKLTHAVSKQEATAGVAARSPHEVETRNAAVGVRVEEVRTHDRILSDLFERARLRSHVYVDVHYPKPATLAEVQAELEHGVVLVEYVLGDEEAWAVVTSKETSALVQLGDAKAISAAADKLVEVLLRDQTPMGELRRLGEKVLDPVLRIVAGREVGTLLFAPHGALCKVPFEILLTHEADPNAPRKSSWPFLIARHDVGYVHSGTVLVAMRQDARARQRPANGLSFAGFGHPYDAEAEGSAGDEPTGIVAALEVDRGTRKPLPRSAHEVLGVARLFASEAERKALDDAREALDLDKLSRKTPAVEGERFRVLLRDRADERTLKQDPAIRTARIVHLACHGEADLQSPSLSRLVLARAASIQQVTGEDGYLYVRDLRDLNLACELLVLSACESTTGKLSMVDGMTGLARAGLASGAEAVVSTLWKVGDASAQDLMLSFYQRMAVGGRTRLRALGDAKREAIKQGMPMRAWSAYVLWDAKTGE